MSPDVVQDLAGRVWQIVDAASDGKQVELRVATLPDGLYGQVIRYNVQRRRSRLSNFLRRAR